MNIQLFLDKKLHKHHFYIGFQFFLNWKEIKKNEEKTFDYELFKTHIYIYWPSELSVRQWSGGTWVQSKVKSNQRLENGTWSYLPNPSARAGYDTRSIF